MFCSKRRLEEKCPIPYRYGGFCPPPGPSHFGTQYGRTDSGIYFCCCFVESNGLERNVKFPIGTVDFALLRDRLILGPRMAVQFEEFIFVDVWYILLSLNYLLNRCSCMVICEESPARALA